MVLHMDSLQSHKLEAAMTTKIIRILSAATQSTWSPDQVRERVQVFKVCCTVSSDPTCCHHDKHALAVSCQVPGWYMNPSCSSTGVTRPRYMQVPGVPKQTGFVECGVFAGIQAEYFCTHVSGEVTIEGEGDNLQVICGGTNPRFLMDPGVWYTQADVVVLRAVAYAGTVWLWKSQNPTCSNSVVTRWTTTSNAWLEEHMPRLHRHEVNLWYDSLQCNTAACMCTVDGAIALAHCMFTHLCHSSGATYHDVALRFHDQQQGIGYAGNSWKEAR